MIELGFRFEGRPRRVRVLVPPGATGPSPVLVLFDGQNVFGDDGSFSGGWHAHAAIAKLPSTVRRPVVVAVDHGGVHRIRELWEDLDPLLDLVVGEVLPAVRARWAVSGDPRDVVVGGSSMGGLAALAAHFRRPDTFGAALAMSPSLWVDRGRFFREIVASQVPAASRVYLDVGHKERGAMARAALQLSDHLAARGYGDRLLWRPDARGTHHERHWRRRLPKALRYLFHRTARPG